MNIFMLILMFALAYPVIVYAQDNSVVIQLPTSNPITSTFRMRVPPVGGGAPRPHRGLDFRMACGTPLQARYGGSLSCRRQAGGAGYGNYGDVVHECGVFERYAHLESCNGSTGAMVSGNTGVGTACHLHHEVRINGVAVDPQMAYGRELCDPEVQRELIEDAQNKLNGRAGAGGPATGGGNSGGPGGGGGGTENPNPVVGPIPPTVVEDLVPIVENTDNAPTACDIDVWRGMVNLAVLQTRREMLTNETLVLKPDSVLAYACIAQIWDTMGQNGGVFSESQNWRNRQINILDGETTTINVDPGQFSLDSAIGSAVLDAYTSFLDGYFEHGFLGGISDEPHTPEQEADPNHIHGSAQAFAACGSMANVWSLAKCRNVDDGTFPSFATLIGSDPRLFPTSLQCADSGIAQVMIDRAKQTEIEFSPVTLNLNITDGSAGQDDGAEYECFPPLRTGVTVYRRTGEGIITEELTYEDGLCLTAGCSFVMGAEGETGTCEVAAP